MLGILEKLFGSASRIKIIRLFLLNPENFFILKEISRRARISSGTARREILLLKNVGFIKEKTETVDTLIKIKKGKIKNKKKKINGFKLNEFFPFFIPLKNLVLNASPINREKLSKSLQSVGKIKMVIISGIFIQADNSRVDMLLVGDLLKKQRLERILKNIEAEIGKELEYAFFTTKEFMYRHDMYDKFVRDVLDYPHEKLLNKLGV